MPVIETVKHQKISNAKRFQLRLPADFHEKLKELSIAQEQSINLLINEILREALYPELAGEDAGRNEKTLHRVAGQYI